MTKRALFLDLAPGEQRGVVTLDGRPERLVIVRAGDPPVLGVGARAAARVRRVEAALRLAFLDLGQGPDGVLSYSGGDPAPREGYFLEVEVQAPARGGKGPVVRHVGSAEGPTRLIRPPPSVEAQLLTWAPDSTIQTGVAAREAADIAEEAALEVTHRLPCGGRIHVEPTQALIAVDVDLGASVNLGRKAAAQANREALDVAARVLRLKGLGGLVALDLVGQGHDGAGLCAVAKAVFAPDGPGVAIGPISRFGVLELALPWRARPVNEVLLTADGRINGPTTALRLLRAIERAAGPGQMVKAACAPDVAAYAGRHASDLVAKIGPRFSIEADPARDPATFEVSAR